MSRKPASLATLFAAGAFVASGSAPLMAATAVTTPAHAAMTEAGCGAKDAKDAKDGKDTKAAKDTKNKKKGEKEASCGKGSCGSKKG